MRRRWLLLDALVLALVLGLLAARDGDSPGPTWANFERVRVGMTRAEVERLLGAPSWRIAPLPSHDVSNTTPQVVEITASDDYFRDWGGLFSSGHEFMVRFDDRGRVEATDAKEEPSLLWDYFRSLGR